MHVQELVPAEACVNQKERKKQFPFFLWHFLDIFCHGVVHCNESHQAANVEEYSYSP